MPGRRVEFADVRAATTWLARFLADPSDALCLRQLAGELAHGEPPHDDRDVLARIAAALVMGRLALVRVEPPARPAAAVAAHAQPRAAVDLFAQSGPAARDDHWIEVQLLDEAGAGDPGQRCRIVTSDQRVYTGYTDPLGVARWTRIAPGTCQVCFPDLDGAAWESVRTEGP